MRDGNLENKSYQEQNNLSISNQKTCKIYKLINAVNNKIYIGQTWMDKLEDRMGYNGNGYSNSTKLFNAIKKYGVEKFAYELLHTCDNQEEADSVEEFYINKYNSQDGKIGYNIKNGGRGGRHSEESKQKIAKAMLGKKVSKETRKRLSESLKGVNSGPRSEEFKEKVAETMRVWHQNNKHPLLGVPRTEKQKKVQSEKLKGRKLDPGMVEDRNRKLREKFAMTEKQELEIIELYNSGLSISDVCDKLKINNRKLYRTFKKYNIELRDNTENLNKHKWKDHNDYINNSEFDIINLYNNFEILDNIYKKYKISSNRLYKILQKHNISYRKGSKKIEKL